MVAAAVALLQRVPVSPAPALHRLGHAVDGVTLEDAVLVGRDCLHAAIHNLLGGHLPPVHYPCRG